MSEQEREAGRREPDESEVEGHIKRARDEGPGEEGAGIRREGDGEDPDVEGHIKR